MIKIGNEDILRRLKHLPKTIECGLHSGFPPCCVAFYVTQKMWMDNIEQDAYNKRIYKKNNSYGYVPCPDCLKSGNKVIVIECDCVSHAEEQAGEIIGNIKL